MKNIGLLVVICSLLSACGTISNKTSVDRIEPAAFDSTDKGVVVFSAGAKESCISFSTYFKVKRDDPASSSFFKDDSWLIFVDNYTYKSDFSDHFGTLNAVQLVPGSYSMKPTVINPYIITTSNFQITFNVLAGETTYLGELYMPKSCFGGSTYEIRDAFDRDIPMAISKNPLVEKRHIVKRLMIMEKD